MFFLKSLWVYNIVNIYCYVLHDTYKVLLKDSDGYKIDLIINETDYETIDKKQLKELKIHDSKKYKHRFDELDKIAGEENNKTLKTKIKTIIRPTVKIPSSIPPILSPNVKDFITKPRFEDYTVAAKKANNSTIPILVVTDKNFHIMTTYIGPFNKKRRETPMSTTEDSTEYDYDYLANEYYDQVNKEARYNNTFHIKETGIPDYGVLYSLKRIFSLRPENKNCSEIKGIGLQAVVCLLDNYNAQQLTTQEVTARLCRIIKIWCLVYIAIAVPFWCTRGWCCCCLCCKFFKPRQTIEEAKKFVVYYPPGKYRTKHGEIRYKPSEREIECYEEFEHFIKTL